LWRDIIKLLDQYKGIAIPNPGNSQTTLFRKDLWCGLIPKLNYPQLLSFARNKKTILQVSSLS
jgi:hypothetical protein